MHKLLSLITSTILLLSGLSGIAQDVDKVSQNLLNNPGFEKGDTKGMKDLGNLDELTENWFSATFEPADIYARDAKDEDVSIPRNEYGTQEEKEGLDHYAGFRAYVPRSKKLSRSYLESPIRTPLEKGKMYCISFDISLADLSKYAVNYIGLYMTNKKFIQKNTGAIIEDPQIKDITNKVIQNMDEWETVCGTYLAKGGENHVIIGCFATDDKLEVEKLRRPRGLTEPQVYEAYYYVDNVSVTEIRAKSQCDCAAGASRQPDIIYSKSVVITDDMTSGDILRETDIYFASLKTDLNAIAKRELDKVAKILNENPQIRLEVVGHCDNDEMREGGVTSLYKDIARQRADEVVEYLIGKGISEMRVVPKGMDNKQLANTRPTPMSIAQNRRVEFVIR